MLSSSIGHGDGAHIQQGVVLEGANGNVCITAERGGGRGAREGHRNKGSLYVGGYLDVNRQPSIAVDRLSQSSPESALFRRLTGDWRLARKTPLPMCVSLSLIGWPAKGRVTRSGRVESAAADLAACPHHLLLCG